MVEAALSTSVNAVCLRSMDTLPLSFLDKPSLHLRDDWKTRRERLTAQKVLAKIEPVEFLQAISLLCTKERRNEALANRAEPPAMSATRNSLLQGNRPIATAAILL
ncbi:hypothetical protein HF263_36850 [Rhizobium leguminosarum]|uniref:hypothetical protein n=1 Tax=Rhizobium leguminosarum TaxID=384 RepID=UPI001C913FC1|nr:hypothetical protein [Rhizobium leguminosarum]MBY2996773.1 hypothetical protein [Rhizobium leguminosarum]MBY3061534.1 hypothetical protein [Rhizobium leguminosarum]